MRSSTGGREGVGVGVGVGVASGVGVVASGVGVDASGVGVDSGVGVVELPQPANRQIVIAKTHNNAINLFVFITNILSEKI